MNSALFIDKIMAEDTMIRTISIGDRTGHMFYDANYIISILFTAYKYFFYIYLNILPELYILFFYVISFMSPNSSAITSVAPRISTHKDYIASILNHWPEIYLAHNHVNNNCFG